MAWKVRPVKEREFGVVFGWELGFYGYNAVFPFCTLNNIMGSVFGRRFDIKPTSHPKTTQKSLSLTGHTFQAIPGTSRSFFPTTCYPSRRKFPKKCDLEMKKRRGLFLSFGCLNWTFNPLNWKSRVRPLTENWRISIPMVGLSTTNTKDLGPFLLSTFTKTTLENESNWRENSLLKEKPLIFILLIVTKPYLVLTNHQHHWKALTELSNGCPLFFCDLILHLATFFPRRVTSPLLKIEFLHLQHLYLGHHLAFILVHARVDFGPE